MHSQSYNEFPDPYHLVLGVTVFSSDNETAIPRRRLSHWQNCQNPEIVWESSGWKKQAVSKTKQNKTKPKNAHCFFGQCEMGMDGGGKKPDDLP